MYFPKYALFLNVAAISMQELHRLSYTTVGELIDACFEIRFRRYPQISQFVNPAHENTLNARLWYSIVVKTTLFVLSIKCCITLPLALVCDQ